MAWKRSHFPDQTSRILVKNGMSGIFRGELEEKSSEVQKNFSLVLEELHDPHRQSYSRAGEFDLEMQSWIDKHRRCWRNRRLGARWQTSPTRRPRGLIAIRRHQRFLRCGPRYGKRVGVAR